MMSSSQRLAAAPDVRRDDSAHRVERTVRACSEAGGMVAVSWSASPGKHVEASVLVATIGHLPVLLASVNVCARNGVPPTLHVAVDGVIVDRIEMSRVAYVEEFGGIFRTEVPLPSDLVDGATHRLEVVAATYVSADETQPEMPAVVVAAAPVGYGSHEVFFYAKRFTRCAR